jgi:RNA-directed DNA polymerase
MRLQDLRRRL